MTEPVPGSWTPPTSSGNGEDRRLMPSELADWFRSRSDPLTERWFASVRQRHPGWRPEVGELVEEFLRLLVELVPGLLGPYRDQVDPLWRQAAELYGSVGAMRGLAAGEIIEEVQHFREILIRILHADPPDGMRGASMGLRDTLRLNRIVDAGVTHASVGHIDALFFALFQGNGIPEKLTAELLDEVGDQLAAIRRENREILRLLRE